MTESLIPLTIGILIIGLGWWLWRPKVGLIARWQQNQQKTERILREDALKHIYRCEQEKTTATLESIAGSLDISANQAVNVVADLEQRRLTQRKNGQLALTPTGQEASLHIIRAHRLWERFLSDKTGYSEIEWHDQADRLEHDLTPEAANQLAAQLGYPTFDPHGDPIPTAEGRLVRHGGFPLHQFKAGDVIRITHLEDEPEAVYAQILAEKLYPGMVVRIISISAERIVFWNNGQEHIVAPMVAANISATLVTMEAQETDSFTGERLDNIAMGEKAEVLRLSPACRGSERRRFLDLGLIPGTVVSAEFVSPSGEPTAYQIRGALIALRSEQAHKIYVRRVTA